MKLFSRVKNVFDNMNRSVLLGLGLVVIAVLIAAAFVLGDTDQVAEESNGGTDDQQVTTQGTDGSGNETDETADKDSDVVATDEAPATQSDGDGDSAGAQQADEGEGTTPARLADTGPVSATAAAVLGVGGYLYYRSRTDLEARRKQ